MLAILEVHHRFIVMVPSLSVLPFTHCSVSVRISPRACLTMGLLGSIEENFPLCRLDCEEPN